MGCIRVTSVCKNVHNASIQHKYWCSNVHKYVRNLNTTAHDALHVYTGVRTRSLSTAFLPLQKCKERVKSLRQLLRTDEEQLKKWLNVVVDDFMSSEDSCEDDDATFFVRPLPWTSLKVNDFFGRLDTTSQNHRSTQSRKMRNKRQIGEPSERPCPIDKYSKTLLWAFGRAFHPAQNPSTVTPSRGRN